jgi:hypothetical protein
MIFKKLIINWVWWRMSLIPATQGRHEDFGLGLAWANV